MVFPKPGLKYKYKYKLPDHVQRRQKLSTHDHTKIYELLSDDDLFDIRGKGLAKLDAEEGIRFDLEKEMNEREAKKLNAEKAEANETKPAGSSSKSASRRKRVSLMKQLRVRQQLKEDAGNREDAQEENNNVEKKEDAEIDASKNDAQLIEAMSASSVASVVAKDTKKVVNRGKKRKAGEVKVLEEETITVPIVNTVVKDDSSKENESEQASGSELRRLLEKRPVSPMVSSDTTWKSWQNSNNKTSTEVKMEHPEKKQAIGSGASQKSKRSKIACVDNDVKLSSLFDFSLAAAFPDYGTRAWTAAKPPKVEMCKPIDKPVSPRKKPPTLLGPFKISGTVQKVEKTPKKKKKKPLAPVPSVKAKIKKPRRVPAKDLSTTQILRRVRYAIEKYFAKMPGTGYRCPRMREQARKSENGSATGNIWLCLVCHKEELDEKGDVMICCDLCEDWYHLRCIGVPDEKYPENMKWYCKRCMAKEIREGTFHPEKFPLFV